MKASFARSTIIHALAAARAVSGLKASAAVHTSSSPCQHDHHAACTRTLLYFEPGHGPRCHLWAACVACVPISPEPIFRSA